MVEERVSQRLPKALLERTIEYHTRRGLRTWCDCHYCVTKRSGTREIGIQGSRIAGWPHRGDVFFLDQWEVGSRINNARTRLRVALRARLNEIKDE